LCGKKKRVGVATGAKKKSGKGKKGTSLATFLPNWWGVEPCNRKGGEEKVGSLSKGVLEGRGGDLQWVTGGGRPKKKAGRVSRVVRPTARGAVKQRAIAGKTNMPHKRSVKRGGKSGVRNKEQSKMKNPRTTL